VTPRLLNDAVSTVDVIQCRMKCEYYQTWWALKVFRRTRS